jgi:hypothetical protein
MHYLRWKRATPKEKREPLVRPSATERFWKNVDKSGSCWEWTAGKNSYGYGWFWVNGGNMGAHRFSYEQSKGSIPEGLLVDHICHNRACVNPDHLRLVTDKQNVENRAGLSARNTSGAHGVYWDRRRGAWCGVIGHNRRRYFLGPFGTVEEADSAVRAKRNELFTHNDLDRLCS